MEMLETQYDFDTLSTQDLISFCVMSDSIKFLRRSKYCYRMVSYCRLYTFVNIKISLVKNVKFPLCTILFTLVKTYIRRKCHNRGRRK